jgi:hypothetical protein
MPIPRIGGPGVPLDLSTMAAWWSRAVQGGAGYGFNQLTLPAGASFVLPPGVFQVVCGPSTALQIRDPVQNVFRTFDPVAFNGLCQGDGANFRLINVSGTVTGATVTAAGSGYTSPPSVAASAGGATFQAVVGGAVACTVGAGGTGYTYTPTLVFPAPPPGGVQATGYVTLTAGAISGVTMTNAGAGYSTPPSALLVRDARDLTGAGGIINTSISASAGTVTAVLVVDGGTYAGATLPTLAFSGGGGTGAAATAVQAAGTGTPDTSTIQPE